MKFLTCALPLLLAVSAPAVHAAQAAPATADAAPTVPQAEGSRPGQAQLTELFRAMELEKTSQAMQQQMAAAMSTMARSMLPDEATAQDRKRLQQLMQQQAQMIRELLAWDKIEPIYRRVYREVFNAAEVQAMIEFYSSPVGRSILHKMPRVMGVAMRELQPLMAKAMQDTRRAIQEGMQSGPEKDGGEHSAERN